MDYLDYVIAILLILNLLTLLYGNRKRSSYREVEILYELVDEKLDELGIWIAKIVERTEQEHDEQVRKLKVKHHYEDINVCDDCVFNVQGFCADSRNIDDKKRKKKLCFKRPAKNINSCKHYNKIDANEKAKRIFDKQYVCPDCGALLKE